MARISFIVFGYRRVYVEKEFSGRLSSYLLSKKVQFYCPEPGEFIVSERGFISCKDEMSEIYEIKFSECLGLRGRFKKIKYKKGLIVGIVLSYILSFVLSGMLWDVRISGNKLLSDTEIRELLADSGFDIGDFWLFVDRGAVESELLSRSEKISWININRRGSVAYVTVSEYSKSNDKKEENIQGKYSNIVATKSCVIEEITVKRGQAEVKVGDTVKAGDVLISGVLPSEAGGGFCYAEGTVIGRCADKIEASVNREYKKKCNLGSKPISLNIKLFNFNINIFKKYRNSYEGCDIIEDVEVFRFFGKSLPLSFHKQNVVEYTYVDSTYSDEELVKTASEVLSAKLSARLSSSDLLKIKTDGEFTDTGYRMYSDIVFLTDVGDNVDFFVD